MDTPASAESSARQTAKKSLFNRRAGRKTLPLATSTPDDLFERSKQSFDAILAERQRNHQAKEAHEKELQEAAKQQDLDGVGSRKKRRMSGDAIEDGRDDPDIPRPPSNTERLSPTDTRVPTAEPLKKIWTSPKRVKKADEIRTTGKETLVQTTSEIIDLGSGSDSEPDKPHSPPSTLTFKPGETSQQTYDDDVDSAEEFPELAAAARARARQGELEVGVLGQATDTNPNSKWDHRFPAAGTNDFSPEAPDPIVQLFISSPIAGTCPLLVRRKLSQRLQEVRAAWCDRQQFPPPIQADDVFLTWRGRRIFSVTSCKSLGIAVDAEGTVFFPGQKKSFSSKDVEGFQNDDEDGTVKVHLEAVTEGILGLLRKEKAERQSQQSQTSRAHGTGAKEDSAAEAGQTDEKATQVRIILKAKGMEDYKVIVRPTTKISQIVNSARKAFKAVEGQIVFIEFDGERLQENDMIQDTEITDMDGLDVHIK